MVASKAAAPYDCPSRGPRTWTVTCVGVTRAAAPRTRTGSADTVHSTGAAVTMTVTRALSGDSSRTEGSDTPMFTSSVTLPEAPATDIGSVIASVIRATALSGPLTSTVDGSALTVPTT